MGVPYMLMSGNSRNLLTKDSPIRGTKPGFFLFYKAVEPTAHLTNSNYNLRLKTLNQIVSSCTGMYKPAIFLTIIFVTEV